MERPTTSNEAAPSFSSPPRILIPKLVESRDKWKAKATRRKHELKKEQIRSRDLCASRERWKERALAAEEQFQILQQQRDEAQRQLEQARAEIASLQEAQKKGSLPSS
jgi:hypothetical protein